MKILAFVSLFACIALSFPLFDFAPDWPFNAFSLLHGNGHQDRLLKLGPDEYRLASEQEKLNLKRANKRFIDMTEQISIDVAVEQGLVAKPSHSLWQKLFFIGSKQIDTLKKPIPVYNYPKKTQYSSEVKNLYNSIDIDGVRDNLSNFTSFYTRYYKTESGAESAAWLFDQLSNLIAPFKEIKIEKIHHKGWDQFSIIVSIPGEVKDKVVVGAHQDSANLILPNIMRAPGADDDGSGTVTTLESLRIILEAYRTGTYKPHNTLEFHWYSAEEGGLLGSIDVYSRYASAKEVVVGMLQQDMTGYTQGSIDAGVEPHFGLIEDYTSVELNSFIKLIIETYNSIPYHSSECGYACSDHASALENGYPSSFLIESEMKYSNKYIHSVMDTIDRIDFEHVREHVKLTVAFAYELSLAKKLH
ncbi:LAP1 [Candida theae]|uniref:Peptide hydrolase n=1 Tax=Candida theae TaxID=1198502 RepID=A0AAD5FXM7_9ASCO|nr:LAP1 [Candida theae]KAI5954750.1 LAP1 [Candida theae]